MCFLKELRPLANVSIFSVCHVHGHASLFLDRLGFQYKLNGDCYISWVLGEGMEINTVQTTYIYLRYKLLAW